MRNTLAYVPKGQNAAAISQAFMTIPSKPGGMSLINSGLDGRSSTPLWTTPKLTCLPTWRRTGGGGRSRAKSGVSAGSAAGSPIQTLPG